MTRDDIIRMAREAGLNLYVNDVTEEPYSVIVERFAALVAAAEREKAAAWMVARSYATGHGDTTEDLLKELEWQVRESERDACAKVCDVVIPGDEYSTALINSYADDIRARGEK